MPASEATVPMPAAKPRVRLAAFLFRLRALIALAILIGVFAALSPAFLTTGNLVILVKHVAINAILAIGITFVILTGGIDLSVGAVAGLAGMIAGALIHTGLVLSAFGVVVYLNVWLVVVVACLAGGAVGAINGTLVARYGVAPFIATLGTMYVARGSALLLSSGATYPNLTGSAALGNTGFGWIGGAAFLGAPIPVWAMIAFAALAIFVTARTPFGRQLYAIGGNERAAGLSGIRVRRVKIAAYVISGIAAAFVGLIIASQLLAAHPATGETFELNAIAAVVLGGTSLMGGRGSIAGSIAGAFVIGVLADGLVLLGVSQFWQIVIKGVVIVLAVVMDQLQQRLSWEE